MLGSMLEKNEEEFKENGANLEDLEDTLEIALKMYKSAGTGRIEREERADQDPGKDEAAAAEEPNVQPERVGTAE